MRPKTLAKRAALLALEKKAEDIVIADVRKLTTITDFFVICSAESSGQLKAIVDHTVEKLFVPSTSTSGSHAIAVDVVGNIYYANPSAERLRMYAPPFVPLTLA